MAPQSLRGDYERIVRDSERLFKSLDKASQKEYALMLKELRQEVADVYVRYSKSDGTLTLAEMQKYNRIKSLRNVIEDIVQNRTNNVKARMTAVLKEDIRQSYAASMATIGDVAGVALLEKISGEVITTILKKPVEGWTVSERMALRTQDLVVRLQGTITNGFVRGDKVQDAAKAIKGTVEKDFIKFRSFAGDINHKVSQGAVKESMIDAEKEADIEVVKVWVTAGDGNVREAHRLLDGQAVRGDEDFVIPSGEWKGYRADAPEGFGEPALDYNCRCYVVADVRPRES